MLLRAEREALAEASRRVAGAGLVVGTAGNLSLRAGDDGDRIVATPTGGVLGELTAEMMSVIDLDGVLVDGDLAPTSEVPLHLSVYASTGAGAVAHAHALASTAVACTCEELPAIHYTILQLGGAIRVAPYATFGSEELAANVTKALDGRVAALMQNHGSVAYGRDIVEACDRLELLEWHAELYARSVTLGTPRVHTDAELEAVILAALNKGYGGTRRVGDQKEGSA
ncbi:MAG: class II aldolase/adducin family protein [Acidimicrobiales bacterium]